MDDSESVEVASKLIGYLKRGLSFNKPEIQRRQHVLENSVNVNLDVPKLKKMKEDGFTTSML